MIKSRINLLIALVALIWHLAIVTARQQRGGWFIFRDRPAWVVEQLAFLDIEDLNDDFYAIVLAAREEFLLRQGR
jgi:hypothetical protein